MVITLVLLYQCFYLQRKIHFKHSILHTGFIYKYKYKWDYIILYLYKCECIYLGETMLILTQYD